MRNGFICHSADASISLRHEDAATSLRCGVGPSFRELIAVAARGRYFFKPKGSLRLLRLVSGDFEADADGWLRAGKLKVGCMKR